MSAMREFERHCQLAKQAAHNVKLLLLVTVNRVGVHTIRHRLHTKQQAALSTNAIEHAGGLLGAAGDLQTTLASSGGLCECC